MLHKAENCTPDLQKRNPDLRSNMKSSLIVLALVAVVAADKIPASLSQESVLRLHSVPVNLFPDGNKISAKSTGISADGRTARRHGQIAPMPLGEANLSIDYEESFMAPFVILDTDYDNFACIHSCIDFSQGYLADFAFIFSRSPSMSDKHLKRCETAFRNIGLDTSRFTKTVQGHSCRYETHMAF
ncbi:crustacyanin subunit C [Penaeus vannamei]|uniref:Crustacyanin subunit C n=1 Tax=Penaeus vannamei TaxID=6689 RepID=A0A3R7M141_PENVA|nr:crustacyanin subunit C [Penaeus vannamei]